MDARGTENSSFYGLGIGFPVMVGAFAVGKISGGVFNRAAALGASRPGIFARSQFCIYLLAERVASAAAAVFLLTQPAEKVTRQARAAESRSGWCRRNGASCDA